MKVLFLILIIERIRPYARKYSTDGWVSLLWGRQKNRHIWEGMHATQRYSKTAQRTWWSPQRTGAAEQGKMCWGGEFWKVSWSSPVTERQRGPQWGARHGQGHNTVNSIKTGTGSWPPQNQALKQEHYQDSKNMCWIETKDRKSASQAF